MKSSPMFKQYHALKAQHPTAVLFFRMGDFYECFFEDAELASRVLNINLTSRNKKDPNPIPMAGVPHHAAAGYLQKLTDAGYRVAIAEQVEDPAATKKLVRREVVRVVTPGVVLDPNGLDSREPNWMMAVCADSDGAWGMSFLDASTGDLRLTSLADEDAVVAEIHRFEPKEALIGPDVGARARLKAQLRKVGAIVSPIVDEAWTGRDATRELLDVLGVRTLSGFGVEPGEPGIRAAGALVRYARDMSGAVVANVHDLVVYRTSGFMVLDDTTRRNLELTRTMMGGRRKGSLLGLLDRCSTAMGSRRLREWMSFTLVEPGEITARQVAVEALVRDRDVRRDLLGKLRLVCDIERINARVAQGTANARDLGLLKRSLGAVPEAVALVSEILPLKPHVPRGLATDVLEDLRTWLVDDPPTSLSEGGLIRRGAHAELDEIVAMSVQGVSVLQSMEERERKRTGITSLKIRRNRVFGFFIEISRAKAHKAPDRYIRKQTLTNAERFITPELKELEERVLGADERRKELEYSLFVALRDRALSAGPRLSVLARKLANLDVLSTMAELAEKHRWVRPVVEVSEIIDIRGGRHPVVEAHLNEERFVPNDLRLGGDRQLIVLTGPNMAGKSTILRQVALVVLLAQMGSFVPADEARVGICDRIFTRVGAADDLASGRSTFMVEMSETSAILHHATRRSLVILDEIGRGTSTYDGLAIAWSVAEDLVDRVRCRGMFATHYHELCELSETRSAVVNQSVAVSEWGDDILFLRKLKDGGASRSYGIQCAKLAGLPDHVVNRAKGLLKRFEKHAPRDERDQLSLFGRVTPSQAEPDHPASQVAADAVRAELSRADPDALTARDALALVYRLREML